MLTLVLLIAGAALHIGVLWKYYEDRYTDECFSSWEKERKLTQEIEALRTKVWRLQKKQAECK